MTDLPIETFTPTQIFLKIIPRVFSERSRFDIKALKLLTGKLWWKGGFLNTMPSLVYGDKSVCH